MRLDELRLSCFRNYSELHLVPSSGLNILVGQNGQGKSNLLEAILLLAISKSIRVSKDCEMIQHGADLAAIQACIGRDIDSDVTLDILLPKIEKKYIRINGSKRPRIIELIGNLNAVYFGSSDVGIIGGEPSIRRRFLNIEISQTSPKYCFDLASYKKSIEQRNHLLKEMRDHSGKDFGLDAWNDQLIRFGSAIMAKRALFLHHLAPIAQKIHRELTNNKENLEISYLSCFDLHGQSEVDEIGELFKDALIHVKQDEIRRGITLCGPQRDDILFVLDGQDARSFASQGQQRTAALSLKLAEFEYMHEFVGEPPLVLLDDVMSDLDDQRRDQLISWIDGKCQSFLSCTNLRPFSQTVLEKAAVWNVENGQIIPIFVRHEAVIVSEVMLNKPKKDDLTSESLLMENEVAGSEL
jgi:DNA replication and repair protein RecF